MQKLATILLVDDDATTNFLNERLLESLELVDQLLIVHNGEEALSTLAELRARPDALPVLVLLDISMPVMDGIEFLETYRQLPAEQQKQAVVIVLTTSMHSGDLARIEELPIAGLVSKPLTREKVNTLLQLHFGRQLPDSV